ncbi:MAG: DUF5119 domain-containing protein [Bacteroides sp.]|jgi:hypothetical protein|nr:DUF5119 domain-containing protein [Bacteroides sp.]
MNIRKRTYGLLLWGSIFLPLLGSCTRQELSARPSSASVSIRFNWDSLGTGDSIPAEMALLFYGSDGSLIRETGKGNESFTGSLPPGEYRVLAYNTDAVGVSYSNLDSYELASMHASPVSRADYLSQPSHAYGIGLGSFTVTPSGGTAELTPDNFIRRCEVNIHLRGESTAVGSCDCTLSGISRSVNLSTGELQQEDGVIFFSPEIRSDGLVSVITFLGKSEQAGNILGISLGFHSGGHQELQVDITDAMATVNVTVIPVVVDATIEVEGTTGGIFTATLTDWSYEQGSVEVK